MKCYEADCKGYDTGGDCECYKKVGFPNDFNYMPHFLTDSKNGTYDLHCVNKIYCGIDSHHAQSIVDELNRVYSLSESQKHAEQGR